MDVTPLIRRGSQVIQSYASGVFKVSGDLYNHAILVDVDETTPWDIGDITDIADLSIQSFSSLIERNEHIDVVLLGCGKTMTFIPPALRGELKKSGLSVDVMDTGAACRTYNVLMAEGRRVVCALLTT
ncbi:MAG: hypothetical protein COB14_04875 [Alphaproteobacteria bacterium]|nr:MAG: hypothetical protein COB14_04875 [Alphaproteobacteria bacterium]